MNKREDRRKKRHSRIKLKMFGTADKPRLILARSLKHISASIVDDSANKILLSLSTLTKGKNKTSGNVKEAEAFGHLFAQKAKGLGFSKVIFDRAGHLYHGRIKVFAEALRKGGLEL